jgi:uncharacterized protein with GYD domain
MPRYSLQISFTTSAWHSLTQNPLDPLVSVRLPLKALGGNLIDAFFTEGAYDLLALAEFPESITLNDISIAFYSGGAIALIHPSTLLDAPRACEASTKDSFLPAPHAFAASAT